MDIHKIFSFCAVVDQGSLSQAAKALYCSQPALSKQIHSLEAEIGYPLFDRTGKKMALNKNGQLLYQFGRHLEKDFNQLKADLYSSNHSYGHEISFGATNFIGIYLLPPILSGFKKQYPDIPINFTVNFFPNILNMLDQDVISFAIIPEDEETTQNPGYIGRPFYEDEMRVVFPPSHPLSGKKQIMPEDLLDYPFLISQIQSATRKFVLSRLQSYGIHLGNVLNMYNTEAIKQGILNGMGISVLSRYSVLNEEQNGRICTMPLQGIDIMRRLYFIHKKSHILSKEEMLFINSFFKEA